VLEKFNHREHGEIIKFGNACKALESKKKLSFRASEARPGIQDFQAILDSGFRPEPSLVQGFRRNDGLSDICKNLFE
jgi:hypothetical protein